MVRVGGGGEADELRQDGRSPGLGVLQAFEDEDGGALGGDEAVALGIEGAAGLGWVAVTATERPPR